MAVPVTTTDTVNVVVYGTEVGLSDRDVGFPETVTVNALPEAVVGWW